MNIGEISKKSGLTPKMIRRYEEKGVAPKPKRSDSGYRVYNQDDLRIFLFIHRSRSLGFSLKDTKQLISLWRNKKRASSKVKAIAISHLEKLNRKLQDIQKMTEALNNLVESCNGGDRPDCPIIDNLSMTLSS